MPTLEIPTPAPLPGDPFIITLRYALLSALSSIDAASGVYQSSPRKLYRHHPLAQNQLFPSIVVASDSRESQPQSFKSNSERVTFEIQAWSDRVDQDDRVDEIDRLVADIQRAIERAPDLGLLDHHVNLLVESIEVHRGIEGGAFSVGKIKATTEYRVPLGSP